MTEVEILILATKKVNLARRIERLLSSPTMQELCRTKGKEVGELVNKQDLSGLMKLKNDSVNLEEMSITRLKILARGKFAYWYRMDRAELIGALKHYESGIANRGIE